MVMGAAQEAGQVLMMEQEMVEALAPPVIQVMAVMAVVTNQLQQALEAEAAAEELIQVVAVLAFTGRDPVVQPALEWLEAEAALEVQLEEMLVITEVAFMVEAQVRVIPLVLALYVLYGLEQLVNSHLPA
jgi:hypothetical protein